MKLFSFFQNRRTEAKNNYNRVGFPNPAEYTTFKKKFLPYLLSLTLIAGLGVTIYLVGTQQDVRQRAASGTSQPIGNIDGIDTNQWTLFGWTMDPDVPNQPIDVHVYVDGPAGTGYILGGFRADQNRPDLASSGYPTNHGYVITIPERLRTGWHTFYVYAIDPTGNGNPQLGGSPKNFGNKPNGDATVSGGNGITIKTTNRLAGAIDSLTWNGKEFVNSWDHGRQIQTALVFDKWGECYNPTEAGGEYDGTSAATHSILNYLSASGNRITTINSPGYWQAPGTIYTLFPQCSTDHPGVRNVQNTSYVSDYLIKKDVTIGYKNNPNIIEYNITVTLPRAHQQAQVEGIAAYLTNEFSQAFLYNPANKQLSGTSGNGEVNMPVIRTTANQQHAIGMFAPKLPTVGFPEAGYGRSFFPHPDPRVESYKINNCIFREGYYPERGMNGNVPAGELNYQCFIVVGTIDTVKAGIDQLYTEFKTTPAPTRIPPPSNSEPIGNHEYSSCTQINGWTCDSDNFGKALEVHFYKDSLSYPANIVGSTIAGMNRPDLAGVCGGTTAHGFSFVPDPNNPDNRKLFDGQPHNIFAYTINEPADGNNPQLRREPAASSPITCSAPVPSGTLTASPNPCTITSGDYCAVTLAWNVQNTPGAHLWVQYTHEASPRPWTYKDGTSGSFQTPAWTNEGGLIYLLKAPDGTTLAQVLTKGIRPTGTLSANPNPCTIPWNDTTNACPTTISWNAQNTPGVSIKIGTTDADLHLWTSQGPSGSLATDKWVEQAPKGLLVVLYARNGDTIGQELARIRPTAVKQPSPTATPRPPATNTPTTAQSTPQPPYLRSDFTGGPGGAKDGRVTIQDLNQLYSEFYKTDLPILKANIATQCPGTTQCQTATIVDIQDYNIFTTDFRAYLETL